MEDKKFTMSEEEFFELDFTDEELEAYYSEMAEPDPDMFKNEQDYDEQPYYGW